MEIDIEQLIRKHQTSEYQHFGEKTAKTFRLPEDTMVELRSIAAKLAKGSYRNPNMSSALRFAVALAHHAMANRDG